MTNKHLLVIGASSDIGLDLLRDVYKDYSKIYVHSFHRVERLKSLAAELKQEWTYLQGDLTRESSVTQMLETWGNLKEAAPQSIVFLASPPMQYKHFAKITLADYQNFFSSQILSSVAILKYILPAVAQTGWGRVVFMLSSVASGTAPKNVTPYVVAKYAALGLMKSLASEFGPKGITVNGISPSMSETSFLEKVPTLIQDMEREKHPLKRLGTPKDITPVIRFLLSEESRYINGATIPVTGGL